MNRRLVFAANWKMNKPLSEMPTFIEKLKSRLPSKTAGFEAIISPPMTHLFKMSGLLTGSNIQLASQNSGPAKSGAFTGEVSPAFLKEIGCQWTLLGHSERRHVFKEDDALVLKRLKAALAENLQVILCVGELLEERKAGQTMSVVDRQLTILKEFKEAELYSKLVVAYEPVWAIGTGENATPEQAEEVHSSIRTWVEKQFSSVFSNSLSILYGGSVKPDNAESLVKKPNIDGLLIGGASLEAESFADIIQNGLKAKS